MTLRAGRGDPRATSLYRLYDNEDRLLYIGISNTPITRMDGHAKRAWWPQVGTIRVEHFANRAEALDAEGAAIDEHRPPYNETGVHVREAESETKYASRIDFASSFDRAFEGFGRAVVAVRWWRRLPRTVLATKVDIRMQRLLQIELNAAPPRGREAELIAEALDVSPGELDGLGEFLAETRHREWEEEDSRRREADFGLWWHVEDQQDRLKRMESEAAEAIRWLLNRREDIDEADRVRDPDWD